MPLVPIDIPPGAFRNGTEYQAKGRWRDVNLVRWRRGAMLPVGGWEGFSSNLTGDWGVDYVRGGMAWTDNAGNDYIVFSNRAQAVVLESDATATDLTPVGFTSGNIDQSSTAPATTWSWSTFGEIPIGCSNADGRLWEWDLNTASNLTQVSGSPTSCLGVLVTAERFVWALGDGGDPRSIRWSDREDRTQWTPAVSNQAGGYDLETEGDIKFALQMRGEVLIVTSKDAWRARYVGYPDVYTFERIGSCTAVGQLAGARAGDSAFWMGDGAFYQYQGGYVTELPSDVWDFVFADMLAGQETKVYAWDNSEFGEVWWLYESAASTDDVDSYVAYSYREGHWSYGSQPASTIIDRVPFDSPIGFHPALLFSPVTNPGFDTDTDWTKGTNWQISAGVASQTAPATSAITQVLSGFVPGLMYGVGGTIASRTTGSLTVGLTGGSSLVSANGAFEVFITVSSATPTLSFTAGSGWDGTLDNVDVELVRINKHETGNVTNSTPYAESGPVEIGNGERRVHVLGVVPDEQDQGELQYTFKHREYPTATEVSEAAITAANPTSVRFSGRQFTMRVEPSTSSTDWRVGVHRLDVKQAGRR